MLPLSNLSDRELRDTAGETRARLHLNARGLRQHSNVVEILSLGTEAIRRVFGFCLHPVQIRAAFEATRGRTIEMQTGEGKTVVSALIGYFYTYLGGVHLATTNQYLANRDYECIEAVYSLLGISCGLISQSQSMGAKQKAYLSDVTFGPGYQFGFDYLADQITLRRRDPGRLGMATMLSLGDRDVEEQLLQRGGHNTMIVDEADSVMIDEALTPLVLSGASSRSHDPKAYVFARQLAMQLVESEDFLIDLSRRSAGLTTSGVEKTHDSQHQLTRYDLARPWKTYIENALKAEYFFHLNEHYVSQEDKVKIVDQLTGRIFEDRQWQDGLHQAVCTKEQVTILPPNEVQARISRQKYFQLYDQLTGLSGTLRSIRGELGRVYGARVALIPTHHPSKRDILPTRVFASGEARLDAIAEDVLQRHKNGQPVLIGTRTIRQSQACAEHLIAHGMQPTVLNGIQDDEESEIVGRAGTYGSITIATNMAGRGTDIKLDEASAENGGLHVVGFQHNFSRRVDRQLVGRSARQGQPGSSQFFQSLEDEMFESNDTQASRLRKSADQTGEVMTHRAVNLIQLMQKDQETKALKRRQALMDSDGWLNHVRETLVKESSL